VKQHTFRYTDGIVLERLYGTQVCSIARALEVVGERWTLLILRDTSFRARRFEELQQSLGMARNVLTDRLQRLCDEGLLERRLYQEHPPRYEYAPTDKARDLFPALGALIRWGDTYYAPDGPPRLVLHKGCGGRATLQTVCSECGQELTMAELETKPGPGAKSPPGVSEQLAALPTDR
jgi:DNA-binding HxlR family transcriptional regulator